jgi:Ni,Fe-hydrogenase maturation factor
MTTSTDAVLVYGYNLGGDAQGWLVAEAGELGEWNPPWLKPDDEIGIVDAAEVALLASVGFTEDYGWSVGYYDRQREALARVGVWLVTHCSGEAPMYFVAAHEVTVSRGDVEVLDLHDLERRRQEEDWDGKLQRALATLQINLNATPAWLLASYWG